MPSGVKSSETPLGAEQRRVLPRQRVAGFGEDADEVVLTERFQLDADRKAPLEFGDQVTGPRRGEGSRRDEQDVVGSDRAIPGVHGGPLEDREQVALHPLTAHVRSAVGGGAADLVDLVDEDDARILDHVDRVVVDAVHVDEAIRLLVDEHVAGLRDGHELLALARRGKLREEVGEGDADLLEPGPGEPLEGGLKRLVDLDLEGRVLQRPGREPSGDAAAPGTGPASLSCRLLLAGRIAHRG